MIAVNLVHNVTDIAIGVRRRNSYSLIIELKNFQIGMRATASYLRE